MRDLSSPLLLSALLLASSSVVGCGEDSPGDVSPIRDLPGVILLDTGDDGDNMPLADDTPPPEFNAYGFWYTYDDLASCRGSGDPNIDLDGAVLQPSTAGGVAFVTTPYSAIGVTPPPETLPNAADNTHGIRFSGSGHQYFGAGLGFKLETAYLARNNRGVNFVTAGIAGFRFWAFSSVGGSYIFKTPDLYSTPEAGQCEPLGPYPECTGTVQNCENAPAITFSLAAGEWTYVEAFFGPAAQVTSGPAQVYGPLVRQDWPGTDIAGREMKSIPAEPTGVFQMQFQTDAATQDAPFDLIVDNVGFIVKGGPVDKTAAAAP